MKYRIVHYEGGAVFEPAEGGYYVPVLGVSEVSKCQYKIKHALRAFRQEVRDMTEAFGEPDYVTKTSAHWTTGIYVGDTLELHIESVVGSHEVRYTGYC